jgi:hypothetical protein
MKRYIKSFKEFLNESDNTNEEDDAIDVLIRIRENPARLQYEPPEILNNEYLMFELIQRGNFLKWFS